MSIEGNPQAAIDFLRWAQPEGPWVLTAIPPDRGQDTRTVTVTFSADDPARLIDWLSEYNGKQNLYWTINGLKGPARSKPRKEEIETLLFLHVDVDPAKPPTGADAAHLAQHLKAERTRIIHLLETFTPAPSAIVDSGGGYQAFWRLDEPLYLGGDLGRAADAEAYNQQLELVLGGDHCFNVDRILRLPGTINLPDERKRKKGRVARLAEAVYTAPPGERVYSLAEFTAAPKVQSGSTTGSTAKVQISGNLPRLKDLNELPERVTARTRMLIVQGDDPDDQTRYGSRSDVVWAVTCELVRSGCTDDMIAAVLLDPDFGISAHVLAQKRSVEYVSRQIQRAREEVEEPMLRMLNEKHAVIEDLGGKCRVISEVMDLSMERPRTRISKQSFDDFRNRYMHQKVQVGTTKDDQPIYKAAGAWWLGHPMRRQYVSLVFAPGREVADAYNLWKGFASEALPGTMHEPFLEHVRDNICSGNEAHYDYLIRWMARAVQKPGTPGEVAVVLRGGQGTGKGSVAQHFGSLWGRHFVHVSSAKHLVGQFNAHLRDCVFLFADEAFFAGDKQHESVLKTLVTEETLQVEAKGVDTETAPNYTHLLMSSNSQWVVPAGGDERRFFVLDVGEGKKQDTAYFRRLKQAMDNGGREALLHFLLGIDLTDYDVRKVPQTEALREQKLYSLSPEEQWWLERLMDGRVTAASHGWTTSVMKERLQADYLRYAEAQRLMRRVSPTALGKFLSRAMPGDFPKSYQQTTDVERDDGHGHAEWVKERVYFYDIPNLELCRQEWDKRYGGPYGWPKDEAEIETPAGRGDDPY